MVEYGINADAIVESKSIVAAEVARVVEGTKADIQLIDLVVTHNDVSSHTTGRVARPCVLPKN